MTMSSKAHPFTSHLQVAQYVTQYRHLAKAQGLETQNHRIYIDTKLMRRYMNPKEPEIKSWQEANTTLTTCVIREPVHSLTIDYFNPEDHQDFLNDLDEYLDEVLTMAGSAAGRAQACANRAVKLSSWTIVEKNAEYFLDMESDETPLLAGNGEASQLRRRRGFREI